MNNHDKNEKIRYFDSIAKEREKWKKKNKYYYDDLTKFFQFIIPEGSRVLEVGCGTGDLLNAVCPERGVGIDFSERMLEIAEKKFPHMTFMNMDAEILSLNEQFDYIILSDIIGHLEDIQAAFERLKKVCHPGTRIIITYYNYLWEPILRIGEILGLKMRQYHQNWLSTEDIENLLLLSGFDPFKCGERLILPKYIPLFSTILNRYLAKFAFIKKVSLVRWVIARPIPQKKSEYSCSVIIPARNEAGNIDRAVQEIPEMGKYTEIIFVEGGSTDNTREEIMKVVKKYKNTRRLKWTVQDGTGKADAVRKGFDMGTGDILMILDADLTVPPMHLTRFYEAIASGKGEFINGSRLVYPMEDEAMQFLNVLGNKFFSLMFTWLLDQRLKDTLCGTKVILKSDYENLKKGRSYFGDFDPFGDFDLIFGASKLNLKIIEIPVHYKSRTYGSTNINRWRHGWLLFKMCGFAIKKMKFV